MHKKTYKLETPKVEKDLTFLTFSDLNYNPYDNHRTDYVLDKFRQTVFNTDFDYIIIPGNLIFDSSIRVEHLYKLKEFLEAVKYTSNHRGKKLYVTLGTNDQLARCKNQVIPFYNEEYVEMLNSTLGESLLAGNVIPRDENNVTIGGLSFNAETQLLIDKKDIFSSFRNRIKFMQALDRLEFPNIDSLNIVVNNDTVNSVNLSHFSNLKNYANIDMVLTSPLHRNCFSYLIDKSTVGRLSGYSHIPLINYTSGIHEVDFDKYVFVPNSGGIIETKPTVTELHIKKTKF